ncbi:MAG: hypothetical protein KC713_05825 [Candidatus Omnitrophica bacterium]|nr:hypothetical protein [Candidatus Omnitrophota bacterium]
MLKRTKHIYFLLLFITGCSTASPLAALPQKTPEIMASFFADVQKSDGINLQEAVLLAKSQIIFSGDEKRFYINYPKYYGENGQHYYILFYPINRTLIESLNSEELVLEIDKDNGSVRQYETQEEDADGVLPRLTYKCVATCSL